MRLITILFQNQQVVKTKVLDRFKLAHKYLNEGTI